MTARIADSAMYAHLWGTPQTRAIFEERTRIQSWLDILAALARAQAAVGLIPAAAAQEITRLAKVDLLDLDAVAQQTRATGHSTLGLIQAMRDVLPAQVHPHLNAGATVQDVTDTWTALTLREVVAIVRADLLLIEDRLLTMCVEHRDTLIVGRTHGQPGAPMTFGFKAASWADEVGRHLDRLAQGCERWLVGQLGGGVGTLAGQGPSGLVVRQRFCAELGLADPGISWLTARDRVAEAGLVLAMITCTLARIGGEVYELQRPEIGELREPSRAGLVGSITMPHKRNPERSEHLDTLARLVRAHAGVLLEGMVGQHERDGRSWKAEWVAFPEVCLLTSAATSTAAELLTGLEIDVTAMRSHVDDDVLSEQVLALLTPRLGRHVAQQRLQEVLAGDRRGEAGLRELVVDAGLLTADQASGLEPDIGHAGAMVDVVVRHARAARSVDAAEPNIDSTPDLTGRAL
ncbi:MAG: adenylosuccinate lyase family protein [Candidatus Nanopelagicales bacterium]